MGAVTLLIVLITLAVILQRRSGPADQIESKDGPKRFLFRAWPSRDKPTSVHGMISGPVIPSMEYISGFASTESQILHIGQSRPHSTATQGSFHSADASLNSHQTGGRTTPENATSYPNDQHSPQDSLNGQFVSALSRAFGSPVPDQPFPISVYMSGVTRSEVSIISQQYQGRTDAGDFTVMESQRGSIEQAPSMISVPDHVSVLSAHDSRSVKSNKTIRSALSDRLRLSRFSSVSQNAAQGPARKSFSASIATIASSLGPMSTPGPADVNVLFSSSRDSISIGMPSAPHASFADSGSLLESSIPRSPLNIPAGLLSTSGSASLMLPDDQYQGWRTHRDQAHNPHIDALRNTLLFDSSFSLPPASPSSDGMGLAINSSAGSAVSLRGRPTPSTPSSSLAASRSFNSEDKRFQQLKSTPPSSATSPSASTSLPRPSPELVASLTSKSLALADALESLETEAIYASFPSTPSNRSPLNTSASFRSPGSDVENHFSHSSPSKSSIRSVALLQACGVDPEDHHLASVDITSVLELVPEAIRRPMLGDNLTASTSQKSSLSLSVADILAQRQITPSLSDEVSFEGMDISDEALYPSRPTSPYDDTPPTSQTSGSSTKSSFDDISPLSAVRLPDPSTPRIRLPILGQDLVIPQIRVSESARYRDDLTIPRVIVQSVDDDLPSPSQSTGLVHSSSSRLSVSVLPDRDESIDLVERTMFELKQQTARPFIFENDDNDDDDEIGSFEGDVSFIRSPAGSRRSNSEHSSEESGDHCANAYDETSFTWMQTQDDDGPYDPDVARRLYGDIEEDVVSDYPSNLAYFNYSRPLLPRQSEVAFRAIMNEGRPVESGQYRSYLGACKENFVPAVSSPLRASYRASASASESGKSRLSDGSIYSDRPASETQRMSPSWSNVF